MSASKRCLRGHPRTRIHPGESSPIPTNRNPEHCSPFHKSVSEAAFEVPQNRAEEVGSIPRGLTRYPELGKSRERLGVRVLSRLNHLPHARRRRTDHPPASHGRSDRLPEKGASRGEVGLCPPQNPHPQHPPLKALPRLRDRPVCGVGTNAKWLPPSKGVNSEN